MVYYPKSQYFDFYSFSPKSYQENIEVNFELEEKANHWSGVVIMSNVETPTCGCITDTSNAMAGWEVSFDDEGLPVLEFTISNERPKLNFLVTLTDGTQRHGSLLLVQEVSPSSIRLTMFWEGVRLAWVSFDENEKQWSNILMDAPMVERARFPVPEIIRLINQGMKPKFEK